VASIRDQTRARAADLVGCSWPGRRRRRYAEQALCEPPGARRHARDQGSSTWPLFRSRSV